MMPRASIIILNFNGKRFLGACLSSVFRQDYPDFEVILVDNASKDDSMKYVRKRFGNEVGKGRLKIVENAENTGFAEGNNIGFRHASKRSKYVVLLNNDTKVYQGWLSALIHAMENDKKIGTAGSIAYKQPGVGPDELFALGRGGTMSLCGELVTRALDRGELEHGVVRAFFLGGFSVAYPRHLGEPFDASYFAYAEDIYLGWISMLRGYRNVGVLGSKLEHYGGGTKQSSRWINKVSVFNGTKNQIMNFLIFYELKNVLRILPLFIATQLAHIIHSPRKLVVKIKAYVWVVLNWRKIMEKRRRIQAQRKTPDREIISFMSCMLSDPLFIEGKAAKVAVEWGNRIFFAYCWLLRIKTREFYK